MEIIHRVSQLCKRWAIGIEPYVLPLIIVLLVLIAFGLGRLSVAEESGGARIIKSEIPKTGPVVVGGEVVALNTGSVYYGPWCKGALSIDPGRARWFKDRESAERAGLRPAKACKGL